MVKQKDEASSQGTKDRIGAILRGAFAGPPTPLKDIPTRTGESRTAKQKLKNKGQKKDAGAGKPQRHAT